MVEYTDKQNEVINKIIQASFDEYHFNWHWANDIIKKDLSKEDGIELIKKLKCLQ